MAESIPFGWKLVNRFYLGKGEKRVYEYTGPGRPVAEDGEYKGRYCHCSDAVDWWVHETMAFLSEYPDRVVDYGEVAVVQGDHGEHLDAYLLGEVEIEIEVT